MADDDESVLAARKASSGPGWPRESPPEGALGEPADTDRGGTQMNLYAWPQEDGRSVTVALAASGERAREMVGDSPGRGPAGDPFVFRLSGIVEHEQDYYEYREARRHD